MRRGPRPRYDALVDAGALDADPAQDEAADRLQALHDALKKRHSGWRRCFNGGGNGAPKGLYLWGPVGRGKTLLMDLFFNSTDMALKRRTHFNEFMAETHERIAAWRASSDAEKRRHKARSRKHVLGRAFGATRGAPDDPMPPVAYDIAQDAKLLCFDEFQVTDIADAMILGRLFTALFDNGVTVVATSNRPPNDLYEDGLNRQLFLPFIALLKSKLDIFELQSAKDYRLARLEHAPVYYQPLGPAADEAMNAAWAAMICGAQARKEFIRVKGRKVTVPCAARGAARFDFEDLCAQPLGASDYLAIVRRYGALYIDRIPVMGPEKRDEAKRFVTLIDAIYDSRTKLVCSAAVDPFALYPAGDGAFEFNRAASRLMEMRSAEYLRAAHAGPGPELVDG